ncbi:MAG: 2-C-methyl-D-erythritol 2,4-cyclodiphosphate synthase [Chlamydiota bacterium]
MVQEYVYKTGLGQDSHQFLTDSSSKPCIIGGRRFEDVPGLSADSDGDPIFHSFCNAITSVTHVPILGGLARELYLKGITDSKIYLKEALKFLHPKEIVHIAFSLEAQKPRLESSLPSIRKNVANIAKIPEDLVGITVTSGDYLTAFGSGLGIQCFCLLTIREKNR